MKYLLLILLSLLALIAPAQNLLDGEREPIVVETKADLQTELELLPIKYIRDEQADSLLKFNYSYHGSPLRSDFVLFPARLLTDYLNLSTGTHDLFEITNYLAIKDYAMKVNYLYRKDEGKRKANIISLENRYSLNKHKFGLSADFLVSSKESPILGTKNESKNISLSYSLTDSGLKMLNNVSVKAQYEINSTELTSETDYWNIFTEVELEPIKYLFTDLKLANNHKATNTQIQIYFQDLSAFGLWTGISQDRAIIAPYLNLYLNHNNLTLKVTNKPYLDSNSYFTAYQNHLYGNYKQSKTDFLVPGNANLELSYFNFLTWSLGSHYKYSVDAPTYRFGNLGEAIYFDSSWETSHYAKLSYYSKSFTLATKAELLDYNNFSAEFLPFKPELRITNSASLTLQKLKISTDYIFESKAHDDYNNKLADSHIINAQASYQLTNRYSFWTELTNLLNKNSNQYFHDQINQIELKAGVKLFF